MNEVVVVSGARTDVDEAKELGLVNFVCEEDDLEEKLEELIIHLKQLPMETVGRFKALVNNSLYPDLESQIDKERVSITELGRQTLFKERLDLFLKK